MNEIKTETEIDLLKIPETELMMPLMRNYVFRQAGCACHKCSDREHHEELFIEHDFYNGIGTGIGSKGTVGNCGCGLCIEGRYSGLKIDAETERQRSLIRFRLVPLVCQFGENLEPSNDGHGMSPRLAGKAKGTKPLGKSVGPGPNPSVKLVVSWPIVFELYSGSIGEPIMTLQFENRPLYGLKVTQEAVIDPLVNHALAMWEDDAVVRTLEFYWTNNSFSDPGTKLTLASLQTT